MRKDIKLYKKELDSIYKNYIKPCLDKKEPLYPIWSIPKGQSQANHPPPPMGAPSLERCSEDVLKNVLSRTSNERFYDTSLNNCNYSVRTEPFLNDSERRWLAYYVNTDSKQKWYSDCERSQFKPLLYKFEEVNKMKCAYFGNPKFYTKWKELEGYMGWHTNHLVAPNESGGEHKLDRVYFVYNQSEGSFFRYLDNNGEIITIEEPKGWSINVFTLRIVSPYLWHCIYTPKTRFSIGIRELYNYEEQIWKEVSFPE